MLIALALSFFVPRTFTAIAFDSGGVASGPLTATFMLPFATGACEALGGNVMTDAFGLVALVAMMPLITVQVMGAIYVVKSRQCFAGARSSPTLATTRSSNCGRPADMELYYIIAITDHDRGEAMGSLYHAAGLHLILSMPARGTATSEHLAIYGLDATEKCVIAAVGSAQEADSLIRSAKRKLFIDIPGNGVMLTVPLKSVAGGKTLSYLTDDLKAGGAPNMNFEHELITVILNEGYSDFVMDAARAAGAGGGTVLHAKGTGGTRGEKFFSVSLADEKDMIYIIAHKDEKAAIMRSINEQAGPGTKAGAICFSLPISSVAGLRAREEN